MSAASPPGALPVRGLPIAMVLALALGAALLGFTVIPSAQRWHLWAIGAYGVLTSGGCLWLGLARRRAGVSARIMWGVPVLLLVTGLGFMSKVVHYGAPLQPEVIVRIDEEGDAFGPDYPTWPKVLVRIGLQPGAEEYCFRPLYFGFLIGPGCVPYQG